MSGKQRINGDSYNEENCGLWDLPTGTDAT